MVWALPQSKILGHAYVHNFFVIGDGNPSWKETTVGKLVEEGLTAVSFEALTDSAAFEAKINEVVYVNSLLLGCKLLQY